MKFNEFAQVAAGYVKTFQNISKISGLRTRYSGVWVTAPVCEVADGLAESTALCQTGQGFVGILGFACPFVSSTGLVIDYVMVAEGDSVGKDGVYIVAPPAQKQRVQEWERENKRIVIDYYDAKKSPAILIKNSRALPRDITQFIMPGEVYPGLTCADIQPLARYVMACLQLLASETVTEVVDEITVNPHSGSGRSRRKGGGRESGSCSLPWTHSESPAVDRHGEKGHKAVVGARTLPQPGIWPEVGVSPPYFYRPAHVRVEISAGARAGYAPGSRGAAQDGLGSLRGEPPRRGVGGTSLLQGCVLMVYA